jgi:uncharacterized protein YndB with AHSA1/START domain
MHDEEPAAGQGGPPSRHTPTGGGAEISDMHFEYTIVINQPVEKVFDYVSNPVNLPEWQGPPTGIRDIQQTTPGQLREGDRFTTVLQFVGWRYETPTEVSAYEPNRRLSYRGTGGPVPTQITFIFEEVPGGRASPTVRRSSREASSGWQSLSSK